MVEEGATQNKKLQFKIKASPQLTKQLQIFEEAEAEDHPLAHELSQQEKEELSAKFKNDGDQLAEKGQFEEALSKWELAIQWQPKDPTLYEQKSQICTELGRSWPSVQAATQAVKLAPDWSIAHLTLGRAQRNIGELLMAQKSVARAIELQPDFLEAAQEATELATLISQAGGAQELEGKRAWVGEGDLTSQTVELEGGRTLQIVVPTARSSNSQP